MAAGVGTRISREINHIPKCTLKVKGSLSLIELSIEKLLKRNVKNEDIAVVVGYSKDSVLELIEKYKVKIYHNPFFKVTNSIASIWFARDFIDGSFIAMNADLFYEEILLDELLSVNDEPFVMLCDSTRIEEADYRFSWKDNTLTGYGKDLPIEETTGEYVGIAKISDSGVDLFRQGLEDMINEGDYNCWWEDVIYKLSSHKKVYTKNIKSHFWGEVDYIEDYERIISYINKISQ